MLSTVGAKTQQPVEHADLNADGRSASHWLGGVKSYHSDLRPDDTGGLLHPVTPLEDKCSTDVSTCQMTN